jgi:all-trans-retinol 13,14-reductase
VARYLVDSQAISRALGRVLLARAVPELSRAFAVGPGGNPASAAIATLARQGLEALPENVRPLMGLRWGYFGTPLDELSFAGLAAATAHYLGGGYYPVGGSGRIAETLARTIQAAGGAVVVGAGVRRLSVESGRVVGVQLDAGEVRADAVVSAIGAPGTLALLDAPPAWADEVRSLPLSMTHVALYLSLSEDPRAWGMDGANLWGVNAHGQEVGWYASFPSLRDPDWKGPHLASIIRLVPWLDRFEHRADDYEAEKAATASALLDEVGRVLPRLRGAIQTMEVATPSTVRRYTNAPRGSTYGLAVTPARLSSGALRAATPVPGLYLSGADVVLPGVVGALLGGVACAVAIGGLPALRILLDAGRLRGA